VDPELAGNSRAPVVVDASEKSWRYSMCGLLLRALWWRMGSWLAFLKDVSLIMNHYIKSTLEYGKVRKAQLS
jgi:hypothetical protein